MQNLPDSKFIDYIEKKVRKTIRKYRLFSKKDKILVAVSGGKDSTSLLHILNKLEYDIEAISCDPGVGSYSKSNIKNIKGVCKSLDVPLHIISFEQEFGHSIEELQKVLKKKGSNQHYCMLCGILKRYTLNRFAREHGFDYLATGHNLDDEAQAFMMNVFRNDLRSAARQGPKPGITASIGFVQRVKPLYHISESETKRYSKLIAFPVYYGICPLSKDAYRRQFIGMLDDFEKKHPDVKHNIISFQGSMQERLKREQGRISICSSCGEPSAGEVCKMCTILGKLGK